MRKYIGRIKDEKKRKEYRRKLSIRRKVNGTAERPRVCVDKTNKHLFIQVIDDESHKTLASISTFGKNAVGGKNKEGAKAVGKALAENLKGQGISVAVFDRGGKIYTGALVALADSLRENGIQI